MADSPALKPGTIPHIDITIPNAEEVRDFYHSVVGWEVKAASQGDYDDYNMIATSTGQPVSGICHARGVNADMPPQWLIYIVVADLDHSLAECRRLGGEAITPVKGSDGQRYCVIKDPAGAVVVLFEAK